MSTLRRPLFFALPYPAPTTPYNDLPQEVRDAWVAYALGNKIGYLDYQRIIRPGPDAYEFSCQMDACLNAGTTNIVYPPESLRPVPRSINLDLAHATTSDLLAAPANIDTEEPLAWLVWASPPAATGPEIDVKANKFIGYFSCPAGTKRNQWMQQLGAAYAAEFGSLAGLDGDVLVLWFFGIRNGSVHYSGAATVTITVTSPWGCDYYFPCNEASGIRRSIAIPADAIPSGYTTTAAGPIDDALATLSDVGPQGVIATGIDWTRYNDGFAVNAWVRRDGTANALVHIGIHPETPYASAYLQLIGQPTSNWFLWQTWDGTQFASQNDGGAGNTPNQTWFMLTAVWDAVAGSFEIYRDGASVILQSPWSIGWSEPGYLILGQDGASAPSTEMDIADVSIWSRPLSATEIAALYNSGAGLRFPFT